jgi:hypothetical protein
MRSGWPCLQLDEQLRICNGGFDLVGDIVYKDYQISPATATVVHSPNYKYTSKIDDFLYKIDPSISRSPEGKLWPAFLHCSNTQCIQTESSSRYNPLQTHKSLYIIAAIGKELGASAPDMLVIVLYHTVLCSTMFVIDLASRLVS